MLAVPCFPRNGHFNRIINFLFQFSNFFNWLVRSIKYLMQEPNDQLLSYNRYAHVFYVVKGVKAKSLQLHGLFLWQ